MAALAFMLPILPGKEEADIAMFERFKGDEREDFAQSHGELGFTRHSVWHQKTPNGTVALVLLEAVDPERALGGSATSQNAFWQRFRQTIKEVHGVDLGSDPPPDVRQVFDWQR